MSDIREVSFPMSLPKEPWKRWLKVAVGAGLGLLMPWRVTRLRHGPVPEPLDFVDRQVITALVMWHRSRGTLDELTAIHRALWSGSQATRFHLQADDRFQRWWIEHNSAVLVPLAMRIDLLPGRFHTLCEIGCGMGSVLRHCAHRLPALRGFIGLDLSVEQIGVTRHRHGDEPAMRFEAADANQWIPRYAEPGWAYLTQGGVLEYFNEAQLLALFRVINQRRPALFAIAEPIAHDFDLEHELRSRPYGTEHSFSHNYPYLFEAAGWTVVWRQEQRFDGTRWLLLVCEVRT